MPSVCLRGLQLRRPVRGWLGGCFCSLSFPPTNRCLAEQHPPYMELQHQHSQMQFSIQQLERVTGQLQRDREEQQRINAELQRDNAEQKRRIAALEAMEE